MVGRARPTMAITSVTLINLVAGARSLVCIDLEGRELVIVVPVK
jgi:hypothetical protein